MKQKFLTAARLLILTGTLVTFSCQKEYPETPLGSDELKNNSTATLQDRAANPNFQKLADTLVYRIKGNCAAYSFIVSYKGQYKTSRSGGQSRRIQDFPMKSMTMYEKYDAASLSKTITATAFLKRLSEIQGNNVNIDAPMWTYLPAHWMMGPNIKTITFRQLFNHTSGFRYNVNGVSDGDDYQTLKNLISTGIYMGDKTYSYNNRNYDLFRLIIPKLANYNIVTITNNLPNFTIAALENIQAGQFANAYKDYCRKVIFNKLGTTATQTIDCLNDVANPGLNYTFPLSALKGKMMGDNSLNSGAQGWVLTTIQMNDFFTTLRYTQTLLPTSLSDMMRDQKLGFDVKDVTADGVGYYWKNGVYNWGKPTVQGYRSLIIGFSDDIQITMMTNSPINLQDAAVKAHEDWHP